jgi:ribulose-5-phosphate 4-epimerase/fuculose-1-phosphate aldolase
MDARMPEIPINDPARCLCDVSRLLFERGLTDLCGGNVSLLTDEGRICITPTCAAQYFLWDLHPDDVVVLDRDGSILQGEKERLSRENDLHLRIYRSHPGTRSVFHLHSIELMLLAERPDLLQGRLTDYLEESGIGLAVLEPDLVGQTPEHDDRLLELLGELDPARPAVVVGPLHGIFSAAPDTARNLVAVDGLACFLRGLKLSGQLKEVGR